MELMVLLCAFHSIQYSLLTIQCSLLLFSFVSLDVFFIHSNKLKIHKGKISLVNLEKKGKWKVVYSTFKSKIIFATVFFLSIIQIEISVFISLFEFATL